MDGFGLLCGHLVGDYVFQDDAQAKGKLTSSSVCAWHCFTYVGAIFLLNPFLLSWPAMLLIGLIHFPIDRWRLAAVWMRANGQSAFLKDMGPWSLIVVDNTMHLVTLYVVAVLDSYLWAGWVPAWDQLWWVIRAGLLTTCLLGMFTAAAAAVLDRRQKIATTIAMWLLGELRRPPAATVAPAAPAGAVIVPCGGSGASAAAVPPVNDAAFRPSPPMPVE
jgi:hypothetical protein